jgi:hypothetical protein
MTINIKLGVGRVAILWTARKRLLALICNPQNNTTSGQRRHPNNEWLNFGVKNKFKQDRSGE